jgi:hypothetical protein
MIPKQKGGMRLSRRIRFEAGTLTVGRPRLELIDVQVLPFMALLKSYCSHAVIHELADVFVTTAQIEPL